VFGGICLYKSPQEALDLAMRGFFRDMIANLNGMYHVMSVDPGLLRR